MELLALLLLASIGVGGTVALLPEGLKQKRRALPVDMNCSPTVGNSAATRTSGLFVSFMTRLLNKAAAATQPIVSVNRPIELLLWQATEEREIKLTFLLAPPK